MRLTIKELRGHIGLLLREYKTSSGVTLYHRSQNDYKVGDVITPGDVEGTSKYRVSKSDLETALENYRKKNSPNLPSRLTCLYASLVPRSRFLSKGKLYAIEPIGITHTTNSRLIDKIHYSRYGFYDLAEAYWEGEEPTKSNLQDMEVLMNSAKVVEIIKEDNRLKSGDKIKFESASPVLNAQIDYYPSDEENGVPFTYVNDNKTPLKDVMKTLDVVGLEITNLSQIDVDKNPSNYSSTININLTPGFVGKISTFYYGQPGRKDEQMVQSSIVVNGSPQMLINEKETRKLVKAFRQGKIVKI